MLSGLIGPMARPDVAASRGSAELQGTPPFRVVRAMFYLDGGTTSAEIVDAAGRKVLVGFDGRSQGGRAYPWHCFVGAAHPSEPGARVLPLWGAQERAMVRLVNAAIGRTLNARQKRLLLAASNAAPLPRELAPGIEELVRMAEARRRTLEALDRGELTSLDAALSRFEARRPLRVNAMSRGSDGVVNLSVADGKGSKFVVALSDTGSGLGSVVTTQAYRLQFPPGSNEDRLALTLVSAALKGTGGVRAAPSAKRRFLTPADRTALAGLLERRKARILREDESR
jgi:hypothetical protein